MFIFKPVLQSEVSEEFRSGNNASQTSHFSWQCHRHLGLKTSASLLRACRPSVFYFVDVESLPASDPLGSSTAWQPPPTVRPAAGSSQSSTVCHSTAGRGKHERKGTEGCVLRSKRQSPQQCFLCSCQL